MLLWLAALGRPEVWLFLGLYSIFLWVRVPAVRLWAVVALLLVPATWFVVPGLTSASWFSPGDQALNATTVIHGNKVIGVADRMRTLTGTALQWEILGALVLIALRRNRGALLLAGAGILWTSIETGLALHGWSASQRFLMEGGACLAVVGAVGAAHAVTWSRRWWGLRWVGGAAVVVVLLASESFVQATVHTDRSIVGHHRVGLVRLDHLSQLVAIDGGARPIRSCGQPVVNVGWQSILAWELDMNTGNVGFTPRPTYRAGTPMMWFRSVGYGWSVTPVHVAAAKVAGCAKLERTTSDRDLSRATPTGAQTARGPTYAHVEEPGKQRPCPCLRSVRIAADAPQHGQDRK